MRLTGIRDRIGREIADGDFVSLAGNMTADNSTGELPNGWVFEADAVHQVYFDDRVNSWSLRMGIEPDTAYNCKYMSHAVCLLVDGDVLVVQTIGKRQ